MEPLGDKEFLAEEDTNSPVGGDDELSLPKATVYKLINEMLPAGISCPKETRHLLISCCVEFIHLLSSEANDVCEKSGRKTISPEHVMEALSNLGFGKSRETVESTLEEAQTTVAKERERNRTNKLEKSGLTEEELIRQQEELFEQARRKYLENQSSVQNSPKPLVINDKCNQHNDAEIKAEKTKD